MLLRARRLLARLRRSGRARVDELLGLLLLIEIELQVWLSPSVEHRLPAALGGVVLSAAVAVRRRWPLGALLAGVGALAAQDAFGGALGQHAPGAILAGIMLFYGAGAFLAAPRARWALSLGLAGLAVDVLIGTGAFSDLLFGGVMIAVLPWAVGRMLRERAVRERAHRERAERLDGEREWRAAAAADAERARIARELHDVIAHSVSVMVIQAAGARTVMGSDPERASASLQSVERAGRDAMAEMRRLLGVLDGGADRRTLAPQPGLADIRDLVARTRAAGLATDLRVEGEPAILSPALDLSAYRIVQEALTNAIKHAGPARAAVRVRWVRDALELEVSDDGRGPIAANGAGSGHGIAGMRERAALHGGSIRAGAGVEGGFAVRARLPLAPERAR
jgi:signal transduction histidine kinase